MEMKNKLHSPTVESLRLTRKNSKLLQNLKSKYRKQRTRNKIVKAALKAKPKKHSECLEHMYSLVARINSKAKEVENKVRDVENPNMITHFRSLANVVQNELNKFKSEINENSPWPGGQGLNEVVNPYSIDSKVISTLRRPGSFVIKAFGQSGRASCDPKDPFREWFTRPGLKNLTKEELFTRLLPACAFRTVPQDELKCNENPRVELEPLLYICGRRYIEPGDYGFNDKLSGRQMLFRCVWARKRPTWECIGHFVDGALIRVATFIKMRRMHLKSWPTPDDLTNEIFVQNGINYFSESIRNRSMRDSKTSQTWKKLRLQDCQFALENNCPYFALEDLKRCYYSGTYQMSIQHLITPRTSNLPSVDQHITNLNWPWIIERDSLNRRINPFFVNFADTGAWLDPPQWPLRHLPTYFPVDCSRVDLSLLERSPEVLPQNNDEKKDSPSFSIPVKLLPVPGEHVLLRLRKMIIFSDFVDVCARKVVHEREDEDEMSDFQILFGKQISREIPAKYQSIVGDDQLVSIKRSEFKEACTTETTGSLLDEALVSDHFDGQLDKSKMHIEPYRWSKREPNQILKIEKRGVLSKAYKRKIIEGNEQKFGRPKMKRTEVGGNSTTATARPPGIFIRDEKQLDETLAKFEKFFAQEKYKQEPETIATIETNYKSLKNLKMVLMVNDLL